MGRGSFISASDQRNEPCSRRAIAHGGNSQFLLANLAAAYRPRIAQSNSAFDIDQRVRISGTTGEQSHRDIREVAEKATARACAVLRRHTLSNSDMLFFL